MTDRHRVRGAGREPRVRPVRRPPVLRTAQPFLDEAGLAVQADGSCIVHEHLEAELMQALPARPVDRRLDERRADTATTPAAVHQHPDLAEAVRADLNVKQADDLAVGHRDDRPCSGRSEQRNALVDVNRRLGGDPGALPGNGGEKLRHCPRITCCCGPNRKLRHLHMLSPPARHAGA
jgi:hypothetical protein